MLLYENLPLQPREWTVESNAAKRCFGNVVDGTASCQLHTPLELTVERVQHQLNASLAIVLYDMSVIKFRLVV